MQFYKLVKSVTSSTSTHLIIFLPEDLSGFRLTGDSSHFLRIFSFQPLKWLVFFFSLQSLTDAGAALLYTMKHCNRKSISLKNKQKLSASVQP